jgi:hypothetical protein
MDVAKRVDFDSSTRTSNHLRVGGCETQSMGQLGQAEFVATVAVSYYSVLLYALKFSPYWKQNMS